MKTAKTFIKVTDQQTAKELVDAGFSYIQEGSVFAFYDTEDIRKVIACKFSSLSFITENKLRF